ncbi:Uncharacterised protein [Enterobacter cloacae]|nr:Uncharacterised protein [Enterobacter cloacae]
MPEDVPAEDEEVDSKPGHTHREQQIPFGRHPLHDAEDQQIQNAAVGVADSDAEKRHHHQRQARHNDMKRVKHRGNKQEQELNRL